MINGKLKNNIELASGFQYSVNIGYDISNDEKIKSFIPTIASIELLEDLLLSTYSASTDRARVLIGAYGKGKSHIILMLLSILIRKDKSLFRNLLTKIEDYNQELFEYVNSYIDSKRTILPVIIQGSSASITQSLLGGLKRSLDDNNLQDIMPDTHFQAAINAIERWNDEFSNTFEEFKNRINEPVNEFIIKLQDYDMISYDVFVELYPSLTSGSEFNPFLGFDVVDLYLEVISKLKDDKSCKFDGIYVVYDEFSKFLESGISKISSVDIKLLQDFAEKCNRSKANQLHLLLVSHKEISNYIDKLPKQKVDGWRGVSERFKHVEVHNNFSQIYDVIASVIKLDKEYFNKYFDLHSDKLNEIKLLTKKTSMFSELSDEQIDRITYECYPLHPLSTFILPRISEKVAQNERTIFTFLSSNQKNTLSTFIENADNEFPLLTPDYIYDYFEPLFRKEVYTSDTYKMWKLTTTIINKLESSGVDISDVKIRMIKTIALIYIVEQFDKLSPYSEIITDIYKDVDYSSKNITEALEELISKQYVIYLKESNRFLKLKETSGIDIEKLISDTIEKNKSRYSIKDIINTNNNEPYLYPVNYNDDKEITRYFDFEFVYSNELLSIVNWKSELNNTSAVGKVYAIIDNDADIYSQIVNNRIILINSKVDINLENIAYKYQAVLDLKDKYMQQMDKTVCQELDIYIEDLKDIVDEYIYSYLKPETRKATYYYMGEKITIYRKAHISRLLSSICIKTYQMTPIINNELINRDVVSSVVARYRDKVTTELLHNQLDPNLGLTGYAQDVTIMRTVLINTGLLINIDNTPSLLMSGNENQNIQNVIDVIRLFFQKASIDNSLCFDQLYYKLTSADCGIGMKKGVIPLFIATVLHDIKQYAVISHKDREMEISAALLSSINKNPSDFHFYLEDWNDDKRDYINTLEGMFSDYIIEREKEYNSFSYIVHAMQRWYIGLPIYSKDRKKEYIGNLKFNKISKESKKFGNSLKHTDINARDFLFNKVIGIFGYKEMTNQITANIKYCKEEYDDSINKLIQLLAIDVRNIFVDNTNAKSTLSSVIRDWYDELSVDTRQHIFNEGEDRIIRLLSTVTNDEYHFIGRLSKAITGLRIDDWNDTHIIGFLSGMQEVKTVIEEYNNFENHTSLDNEKKAYTLIIEDKDSKSRTSTFDKVEYSHQAKILFNDLTATLDDEYGNSLPESEKRQVLMDILSKMLK